MNKKIKVKEIFLDLGFTLISGIIVAFGLHVFANSNGFAPGGISGVASILSYFTNVNMGYYMLALNIPLCVLSSIFVEKKLGAYLVLYILAQSIALIFFEKLGMPFYQASGGNLIFATIATGVITGLGYAFQIRRHGASGGTYAIASLIKHWNPAANVAWISFALDSVVVILVFFLYGFNIEATICTMVNLFIANIVVDYVLQGAKEGYKFEIITDNHEEMSMEIMTKLGHGVTELNVHGMYTHKEKHMVVCIVRKRELSKMMKILKKYPSSFASFSKVNEVLGKFAK